jgi:hypothetical protein
MDRVLGIFAKGPWPGRVKNRLAVTIGAEQAARLYDAFLRDLLPRLGTVKATRVLAFESVTDHDFFAALCGDQFELEVQARGDLGERMESFFRNQIARGATSVVLVGSDSPDMPLDRIHQAFRRLDDHELVIGPSEDGGYYLIGMRQMIGQIFSGIRWSTDTVFAETTDRLRQIGVRFTLIDPWYDVDRADDLHRLTERIVAARHAGQDPGLARTEAILRELLWIA